MPVTTDNNIFTLPTYALGPGYAGHPATLGREYGNVMRNRRIPIKQKLKLR